MAGAISGRWGAALGAVLALAAAVLVLALGDERGEAAVPGKPGTIVFKSFLGDNDAEIFVANSKLGNQRQLTSNAVSDGDPGMSPDGKRIVFRSERDNVEDDIWSMKTDGTGLRQLTDNAPEIDDTPAFAPNGEEITFTRRPDETFTESDIWVMNADGTGERQLTSGSDFDHHPQFSPDGKLIAFFRDGDLWLMNADGTNERLLEAVGGFDGEGEPTFSPDGKRIAYNVDDGIRVINADGSGDRPLVGTGDDTEQDTPAFSPDGRKLIFDQEDTASGDDQLARLNLKSGSVKVLTDFEFEAVDADWGRIPVNCAGKLATAVGTKKKDRLRGSAGKDVIAGLDGGDRISGLGKKDRVCGGKGKDRLKGGSGKDKLRGGKGDDVLNGGGGADACNPGKGDDVLKSC